MQRPMLVGQAPGANTDPLAPLYPASATCAGGRLAAQMGLGPEQYLELFDRCNLIEYFPGRTPSKEADRFPDFMAKIAASGMKPLVRGRTIILLGRRVALAWGDPVAGRDWFEWTRDERFDTELAVVPHPSGRNRFYNTADNRDRAQQFWQDLLARLGGTGEAVSTKERAA